MHKIIKDIGLIGTKSSLGVEIILRTSEEMNIRILRLMKVKNELRAELLLDSLTEIQQIKEYVKYDTPVILLINGKGILTKKIKLDNNFTKFSVINDLLPNAKADDFYTQITPAGNDYSYISIIRTNILQNIIEQFHEMKYNLYDIGIGNFYLQHLVSTLSLNNEKWIIEGEQITIEDGAIKEIVKSEDTNFIQKVNIGDEEIPVNLVNAFASSLYYFVNQSTNVTISDEFNILRKEFIYKTLIRKVGIGVMGVIFILLLINYLLFTRIDKQVSEKIFLIKQNNSLIDSIDSLKKDIGIKEQLIQESGFLNTFYHSYMADRLAYTKPKEITLNTLVIQKSEGDLSEDERIIYQNKIIEISGQTEQSIFIDNWITRIKTESWVKDIQILEYKQDLNEKKGKFKLSIEII